MRIILKIIAAPAVLALTLIVAVLNFSVSLASWVLGILSFILAVCGLFELFIQSNPQWGITGLVLAFLLSPFGLPAAAEWLVCKLDDLTYSLKTFNVIGKEEQCHEQKTEGFSRVSLPLIRSGAGGWANISGFPKKI